MEIKYQEGELVLEISESKYLKFSDETEYKKIFEILTDPSKKKEIEEMIINEPKNEDIRIQILKEYQEKVKKIEMTDFTLWFGYNYSISGYINSPYLQKKRWSHEQET